MEHFGTAVFSRAVSFREYSVSERREIPLPPQGQEHFSFGKARRNGTIWKRIKDYFLSENTL